MFKCVLSRTTYRVYTRIRMYSWPSSSSHVVWDKNSGSTYRRIGAVTPSAKIASRVIGFLVYSEEIETRTLGSFFYRRFLEKQNSENQVWGWIPRVPISCTTRYHVFILFERWAGGVSNNLFSTSVVWRRKLDDH